MPSSALKGNEFLLKLGDGAPTEVFTTIAALAATSMSVNGDEVRVPTKDDTDGWSELLDGGGEKTMEISADGPFTDAAGQKTMRTRAMDGSVGNFQLEVSAAGEVIEGGFAVTSFEHTGNVNEEQTYSVTLTSSGKPTVT